MIFRLKKSLGSLCLLIAVAIFQTGCGNIENTAAVQEYTAAEPAYEPARQPVDWSGCQVVTAQDAEDGAQWYLREYYENWITYPETYSWHYSHFYKSPAGDVCAQTQYAVYNDDGSFARAWYCLDYFDIETGDSFHAKIDPDEWGLPETANLALADVAGDKLIACCFYTSEQVGTPKSYCSLIFYHMENGVQKTLDLLPALTAAGMADSIKPFSEKNILCDQNGCCYIVLENKIIIVSDTGELLLLAKPQEDTASLTYLCKTPDGLPVFVGMSPKDRSNTYWIFDRSAGEMRSLGQSGHMSLNYSCMDSYGYIYYLTSMGKIVRWNALKGAQENIFDCGANNICGNTAAEKLMAVRENGDLIVLAPATENKCVYVLSPNPPGEERVLTLVSTSYAYQMEQTAAALYSMKKPGVRIEFSAVPAGENSETYTANLINRIVAGDAPDMFVVSAQTMDVLYEKGALADISDMIPEQLREQVFGCVWNAGTIDGKLIGLTTGLQCRSMLVANDVWPGDTWTLEDMLKLAEQAPEGTLKGLIPMTGYNPDPSGLLYEIALRDIGNTFVDREAGTCHFDGETFRKLLEYCKNTPVPETDYTYQDPAPARSVVDGEYIAYSCGISSLLDFSDQMSKFPEGYHWVGVPTDRDSGNLVYASYFLVVNKNTENMDLIREFLPILYGDEMARKYPHTCLRRDVLRDRVVIPEWDPIPQFSMGEGTYLLLPAKPDGTSYVEEYIAFMDSGILFPTEDDFIASTVLEEAAPYFSGDKDIDTVIDIIQSRVQIYLDENS